VSYRHDFNVLSSGRAFFFFNITTAKDNFMEKEALRVSEFCQRYSISKASFYRETASKRLNIVKRGRSTLVTRREAERWLEQLSQPNQVHT